MLQVKALSKQLRMEKLRQVWAKYLQENGFTKKGAAEQECCRKNCGKFLCRKTAAEEKVEKCCTNKVLSKQLRMEKFLKTSLGKISTGK